MKLWSNLQYRSKKTSQSNLSEGDRKWIILSLIGVQVFLTIGIIFAATNAMSNTWQFLLGMNLLVFAWLFHSYRIWIREKKQKLKTLRDKPLTQFRLSRENSYLM